MGYGDPVVLVPRRSQERAAGGNERGPEGWWPVSALAAPLIRGILAAQLRDAWGRRDFEDSEWWEEMGFLVERAAKAVEEMPI